MSSEVDICNIALGNLGDEATVASLTENSAQASYCARYYPIARDMVLQRGRFGFTLRRVSLALLVLTPPSPWVYAYATPNNWLGIIAVLPPEVSNDQKSEKYTVEAQNDAGEEVIYTNVELATVHYIQRVTNTGLFKPLTVIAIARLLSSFLAGPIIKGDTGASVAVKHRKIYEEVEFPQAVAADANDGETNMFDDFVPSGIAARNT